MFWKSIIGGFAVLSHWQVWVAVILYIAVNIGFLMIVAKVSGEDESSRRIATGCFFYYIGGAVLHGILMSLMVAFLLPILLGSPSAAPISVIIVSLWPIIKSGLIAIVAVTILIIIPIVGSFIARSPGIQVFLEGIIIFRLLSGYAIEQILIEANVQGNVYPGFWAFIGFLVIAGVLYIVMLNLALLFIPVEDTSIRRLILIVFGPMFGIFGGIITMFMYISYVLLSIMQLIG